MLESGVAVAISADSSAFMRGMEQSKAIARAASKDIQSAIAAIKLPPMPDLGKVAGLNKQQVFRVNAEILADTKATVQKLKAVLEEEAAAYRNANKFRNPEINRRQLSGTRMGGPDWSHLEGTQFQGGTRGSGTAGGGGRMGSLYGLGVGYNAIQDLVQGGPMAVANNVPQIIELVAKSPALKMLGAAAFAAASGYFAYSQISQAYNKHGEGPMRQRMMMASQEIRAKEREYQREQAAIEAGLSGSAEGESIAGKAEERAKLRQQDEEAYQRSLEISKLEEEANMAAIDSQKDRIKVERERAELQINNLRRIMELEATRARNEYEDAEKNRLALDSQLQQAKQKIDEITNGNRRAGTAMTEKETLELERLRALLPGLGSAASSANSRSESARRGLHEANAGLNQKLPLQERIINQRAESNIAEIAARNGTKALNDFFRSAENGMKALADIGAAYERAAQKSKEQAKARADLDEQLEMAEMQAGGSSRKARKLLRERDLQRTADRYREESGADKVSPEQAMDYARRMQRAQDRIDNPRRIRGAGADGPAPERASALDYFDGKSMGKPSTSKLDDYERRRSIPGVGGTVDKELEQRKADEMKKAADAAKPPKGDERTHALLQQLLEAFKGLGGNAAPEPASPAA